MKLAQAWNVGEVDAFGRALDEHEVIKWELSPAQLRVLVDYFRRQGRFGTWSEMMEVVVEACLREANPAHGSDRRLTRSESWAAIERIATAVTLGRKSEIGVPGERCPPGAVDLELLLDWDQVKAREVMDLGLFEAAAPGLARFQTPWIAEFLAGRWLACHGRTPWQAEQISSTLMLPTYVGARRRVPTHLRAVAGWIAGAVPLVRKVLVENAPHIVLMEGDPGAVPIASLREALRRFCADASRGRWKAEWPTAGTYFQIGRCDIGHVVAELLETHTHAGVLIFLLRLARTDKLCQCGDAALRLALDRRRAISVRAAAIEMIRAAGSPVVRSKVAAHFRRRRSIPEALKASLIRVLASGDDWSVDDLARIAGRRPWQTTLSALAAVTPNLPSSDLTRSLDLANPRFDCEPAWGAECLARLVVRVLNEVPEKSWPATLGAHLVTLDYALSEVHADGIHCQVNHAMGRQAARRLYFNAFVSVAGTAHRYFEFPVDDARRLLKIGLDDLPELVQIWLADPMQHAMVRAIERLIAAEGEEAALRSVAQFGSEVQTFVRECAARVRSQQAERPATSRDQARADVWAKSKDALLRSVDSIANGTNGNALAWLCQHVDGPITKYSPVRLTTIRTHLGNAIEEAMVKGLRRFWRLNVPPRPVPGSNSTPNVAIIGLRGVELEAGAGALADLSAADATAAAWYAMHEINGLPHWFETLLAAHPAAVTPVIKEMVQLEWTTVARSYGLLSSGIHEGPRTRAAIAGIASDLLVTSVPSNAEIFADALTLVLSEFESRGMLATRLPEVAAELERDGREEHTFACLRAWSHVSPGDVADWLERDRGEPAGHQARVLRLAAALGQDIDERRPNIEHPAVDVNPWSPSLLARWLRLVYAAAPPEGDRPRTGPRGRQTLHAIEPRDYVERFRDRLVSALAKNHTDEARRALRTLRRDPALGETVRAIPRLLQHQAQLKVDHEARAWTEQRIRKFEADDETPPRDTRELVLLVRRHLDAIREEVERGDFRVHSLFRRLVNSRKRLPERELQLWLAQTLKLVGRGLYDVAREPEVDERKKPDISVTCGGCVRVPIEIKPADRYSFNDLDSCVREQLVGRYMKPESIRYGVLVVAHLGVQRSWTMASERGGFRSLVDALNRSASGHVSANALEQIHVVGIQLVPPE